MTRRQRMRQRKQLNRWRRRLPSVLRALRAVSHNAHLSAAGFSEVIRAIEATRAERRRVRE